MVTPRCLVLIESSYPVLPAKSHHSYINGMDRTCGFYLYKCPARSDRGRLFRLVVTEVKAPSWVCAAEYKLQIHKALILVSSWVTTAQLQQSQCVAMTFLVRSTQQKLLLNPCLLVYHF